MPGWTNPDPYVDLEVPTPTKLNTQLNDNLSHLHDWLGNLAYTQAVADSAGFTAETTLLSLVVPVPAGGRDIELRAALDILSTVAGDEIEVRIKEGGTTLMARRILIVAASKQQGFEFSARAAAPAEGNHTYDLKAVRISGTGTLTAKAGASNPMFLRGNAA